MEIASSDRSLEEIALCRKNIDSTLKK